MARGIKTTLGFAALAIAFGVSAPGLASESLSGGEMLKAHATLLGLARDEAAPEQDDDSDLYYSIVENPDAPRLVTRLEIGGIPCRARSISALQFPAKWATLTLGIVDLRRVTSVVAYASVDDMIAEINPVPFDAPQAEQVVLTGKGLYCLSRLSLSGEGSGDEACADRLDLSMMDAEQKARGRSALAIVASVCDAPAFRKKK